MGDGDACSMTAVMIMVMEISMMAIMMTVMSLKLVMTRIVEITSATRQEKIRLAEHSQDPCLPTGTSRLPSQPDANLIPFGPYLLHSVFHLHI